MEDVETVDRDSGLRKGVNFVINAVWISFCFFVLYVALVPFLYYLESNELLFPYMETFMPTFERSEVTSTQYYFSLIFMHLGYVMTIVLSYNLKKMLQKIIIGRFFTHDSVIYIKISALSIAYMVVCPLSVECAIYLFNSVNEFVRVFLLGYVMPWVVIGIITFIALTAFKRITDVYEEVKMTV